VPEDAPAVHVIVALPFTLTVDAECLGVTTGARLGSLAVDVLLPAPQRRQDGRPFVAPPPTPGLRTDIDWSEQLSSYFPPWGSVVSWRNDAPLGKGDTVDIFHLMLRTETTVGATQEDAQNVADNLLAELKEWTHRLADWVELIRATYLDPATFPGEQSITLGSDIIVWQFDDTRAHTLSRGTIVAPVS